MKIPSQSCKRPRGGITIVELVTALALMVTVLASGVTFVQFAAVSYSSAVAQTDVNDRAGYALAMIHSRVRLATSMAVGPTGNTLTLGFDDNYEVDSDGDGTTYNDHDHFEKFKFIGVNSTNSAACSNNTLVYYANTNSTSNVVLVSQGL